VTAPAASTDAAVEPAAVDGDNADVTTKLELAQAYEEMGDREGARELLEEVVQEGSARQQELARAKLASLHG
jgi:pilus assembly protein FimV